MEQKSTVLGLPSHLGGHNNVTHIDEGALRFLKDRFNIQSMLDIGCGPGDMFTLAEKLGIPSWWGVDGDNTIPRPEKIENRVIKFDFTTESFTKHTYIPTLDLAWSVEFLEHVEEKYIPNYMEAFKKCKYALVTAAPPGYTGHHHVNCRTEEYWHGVFAAYGFRYNHKLTQQIRKASTMKKPFMQRTGMFFEAY